MTKLTAARIDEARRMVDAGATRNEIAARFGVSERTVHRVLGPLPPEQVNRNRGNWTIERRRRIGTTHKHADESRAAWVGWLRRYAAAHDGQTPGITAFRNWNQPGRPEPSITYRLFGSWTEACRAAGLEPTNKTRRRNYRRRWTDDECAAWVRACGDELGRIPSVRAYEAWARGRDGAPSGMTVRNRFETWTRALNAAGYE